MSIATIDIERVVREVLAELAAAQGNKVGSGQQAVGSDNHQQSTINNQQSSAPRPPASTDLLLDSRVVTMEEVAGRLGTTRRVVVSRKAIVTPAVRDELIRRGVTLSYVESSGGQTAAPIRLVMITTGTDFEPTSLIAGLKREGINVEHSASNCIIASTDQLAGEVAKADTLGVLLTRYTAAGLCLANRHGGVRAVLGAEAPAVAVAAASVGANLLVADPRAGTFFQLKQLVAEFCRGGVRLCPDVFRKRLA